MRRSSLTLALALLPVAAYAQVPMSREHDIPLKPWPAPLYWQQTQPDNHNATARPDATVNPLDQAPVSLVFVAMTPCRVVDTRSNSGFTGSFGQPSLVGGEPGRFQSNPAARVPFRQPPRRILSTSQWFQMEAWRFWRFIQRDKADRTPQPSMIILGPSWLMRPSFPLEPADRSTCMPVAQRISSSILTATMRRDLVRAWLRLST